jgi:hypothetical protein
MPMMHLVVSQVDLAAHLGWRGDTGVGDAGRECGVVSVLRHRQKATRSGDIDKKSDEKRRLNPK